MFGTRQVAAPARGRSILALSALALVAFCFLPLGAQASSAGFQYSDAPQSATGNPASESNLTPGSTGGGGKGSAGGAGGGKKGGANGSNSTAGGAKGAGKGGSGAAYQSGVGAGEQLGSDTAAPGSDSGGSSPLVPILIAIVLLAGGSVAYVMIKRRRAGGADGSSPSKADPGSPKAPGTSPEAG